MYQEFSRIYEEKIREDFDYKQMAAFVRQSLTREGVKPGSILDMGCGTGNASLELITDTRQMILCDPSADMLSLARNKFRAPYLPQFIQGRADEVRIPNQFDLILSVLDVPNYLTGAEAAAYLKNCSINLKEGGLAIFDLSTVFKLEEMARTGIYIYDDENYFHVWENTLHDVSGQGRSLEMEINLFIREDLKNLQVKEPLYRRITEQQTMYFHTKDEIEKGAQKSGLKILGVFDGYTDKKAEVQSNRMVFVLKKEKK